MNYNTVMRVSMQENGQNGGNRLFA